MSQASIYQGAVRRIDLNLRAFYPELNTTIYHTEKDRFEIYCENVNEDFNSFKEGFDHRIKFITTPVNVVKQKPQKYLDIVPKISDKEISKDFEGVPMNKAMLLNLLMDKFPNVHFYKLSDGAGTVKIHIASYTETIGNEAIYHFLSNKDRESIMQFLEALRMAVQFTLIEHKLDSSPLDTENTDSTGKSVFASDLRRNKRPEFIQRDEALWFDNLDKIFEGGFKKDDLYFYEPTDYSCYIDYSLFGNIDIRNLLFLFQTVYLSPPIEKDYSVWLKDFKINKNDFFELVCKGRIRIVLPHDLHKYNQDFISEIYQLAPNSIISKRALAALQQIDFVELADNYLFSAQEIITELKAFSQVIGKITQVDVSSLYKMLVWPISARRHSFDQLTHGGLMGISTFGVNKTIDEGFSSRVKRDLTLEFAVTSPSIHLASALNATYFPYKAQDGFSDATYANMMGELLNFYRNATVENLQAYIQGKKRASSGVMQISPIELIEVNEYIPLREFEEILSKDVVYPKSKRLIETLSDLNEPDRKRKIELYNKEVNHKINGGRRNQDYIDLGTSVLMDLAGAATKFTFLGAAFSLLKIGGKSISKMFPSVKNVTAKIEEAMYTDVDKANIHYLTKINRVARVKRQK